MSGRLHERLADAVGEPSGEIRFDRLAGGDTSEVFKVETAQGLAWVVKLNRVDEPTRFGAEAQGLLALAETNTVRVPRVHRVAASGAALVLEAVDVRPMSAASWQALGTGLGKLHAIDAGPRYGWSRDNFLGPSPQPNGWLTNWTEFWRTRRLEPHIRRAVDSGLIGTGVHRELSRIVNELEQWIPAAPPSALLHGDLWSGNVVSDRSSEPVLIDPAVYVGDAEADLAMTRLFGGFTEGFYRAYHDVCPRRQGWEARAELYALYHWLNHLNAFGTAYLSPVARIAARFGG